MGDTPDLSFSIRIKQELITFDKKCVIFDKLYYYFIQIWRSPNLSELTPIIFVIQLTHLGLEASMYIWMVPKQSELTPY